MKMNSKANSDHDGNTVTIKVVATNASTDGYPAMHSDGWIVTVACNLILHVCSGTALVRTLQGPLLYVRNIEVSVLVYFR